MTQVETETKLQKVRQFLERLEQHIHEIREILKGERHD